MSANAVSGPHGYDRPDADRLAAAPASAVPVTSPGAAGGGVNAADVSFGDVLLAINPLQYLPVVGTIYRAVTGDVAPEGLRTAVSIVAGAITGGPVGVIGSILGSLAENVFHLEEHARDALAAAVAPGGATPGLASSPAEASATPGAATSAAATRAAAAYASAGLLGSV